MDSSGRVWMDCECGAQFYVQEWVQQDCPKCGKSYLGMEALSEVLDEVEVREPDASKLFRRMTNLRYAKGKKP